MTLAELRALTPGVWYEGPEPDYNLLRSLGGAVHRETSWGTYGEGMAAEIPTGRWQIAKWFAPTDKSGGAFGDVIPVITTFASAIATGGSAELPIGQLGYQTATADTTGESSMFDWLTNIGNSISDTIGGWFGSGNDVYAPPDMGDFSGIGDLGGELGGFDLGSAVSDVFGGEFPEWGGSANQVWDQIQNIGGQIFSDTPGGGNVMPMQGVQQAGFPMIGAVGAAALGIARAGAARIMLTMNGVRKAVSTSTIWGWLKRNPASLGAIAAAAGMTADQLAQILITNPPKRRRRRGITPRDLSTTRRTMRKITTMSRSLSELCRHAPRRR